MSNEVFPALPGLMWDIDREEEWKNMSRESDSGRDFTRAIWTYPRRHYKLQYEFLRSGAEAELQALVGFFNRHKGDFETWLFDDPIDNLVGPNEPFGTGTGAQLSFQLMRSFGGSQRPVFDLKAAPVIKVDGVVTSATVSPTGLVTFASAPAVGKALTWSGGYYWRCKFKSSRMSYRQFMQHLFSARSVEFETYKP